MSTLLALDHPESVIGIHLTTPELTPEVEDTELSDVERSYLAVNRRWDAAERGYSAIQSTKPQTVGYGLNDSPVGLAGWIVEKYRTWSDCHGEVESRFTKDELLATLTIYWVTQTINSSTRLYYETLRHPWTLQQGERINVPTEVKVAHLDGVATRE